MMLDAQVFLLNLATERAIEVVVVYFVVRLVYRAALSVMGLGDK